MRLIVEYEDTDEYTYTCTTTIPVVYESAKAFLVDFEEVARSHENCRDEHGLFTLGGQEFHVGRFFERRGGRYAPPEVYTVDEWFNGVEKE